VEFETEIQVSLAESYYKAGQFEQAWTCAQEAVVLSQRRSNRLAECRALIVLGGVMGQKTDAGSQEEASALLDQAEHLIHMTGAKIYQQGLLSERGRSFQLVGR
jgi:adenylate cyclase